MRTKAAIENVQVNAESNLRKAAEILEDMEKSIGAIVAIMSVNEDRKRVRDYLDREKAEGIMIEVESRISTLRAIYRGIHLSVDFTL